MTTDATTLTAEAPREFERLMKRTRRQALHMAYSMTGNRDEAEDLTQEAYVRAYRAFGTYNRQLPFESWFFRILGNLSIDMLRRRPKVKPLSLDQPVNEEAGEENLLLQLPDKSPTPEAALMRDTMDERVANALEALPQAFRTAVWLCDVEGLSYEEIAQRMGSSVGTVRSRIHRGRQALRKAYDTPDKVRGKRAAKMPALPGGCIAC